MKKHFNTRRYGKRKWQKRKDHWKKKKAELKKQLRKQFPKTDRRLILMSGVSHHALIPKK